MNQKQPDNRKYSQTLPRDAIMKLEIAAAERTQKTGIQTSRTDLVKEAVAEYIERRGL